MSSGTGRGLRPGGVIRALGRLLLMIVFGFGAGLLIGVLSEEPELLAGHLRGESEAVVLAPVERVPTMTELEVAETTDSTRPKPEKRTDPAPEDRLPQVAASAAKRAVEAPATVSTVGATSLARKGRSQPWAIQVGAFSDEHAARKLSQALDGKGYPAQVLTAGNSTGRWRVRIQPIASEDEAQEMATRLKRVERLPTWVLPMEATHRR